MPHVRLLVLVVGALAVVGLGSTVGYRALRNSSLFDVRSVVITGANPGLSAQVQTAVRSDLGGRSLLAVSSGALARALEGVPGVRMAHVDRDFPATLRIQVWPEHAVAVAVNRHDRVIVSATGRVLARIPNRSRPPNLPRVGLTGHGVPDTGTQIADPKVLAQLEAVSAIPTDFAAHVIWAHFDPDHGLELQLRAPARLMIRLGPPVDLSQKLHAAQLVLQAYPTLAQRSALHYVDVSAPARPSVMPWISDETTLALVPKDTASTGDATASGDATATTPSTTDPSTSTSTTP